MCNINSSLNALTLWTFLGWVRTTTIYRKHSWCLSWWLIQSQTTTIYQKFITDTLTSCSMLLPDSTILSIHVDRGTIVGTEISSIILARTKSSWILISNSAMLRHVSIHPLTTFHVTRWIYIGACISMYNGRGSSARVGLPGSLLHSLHSYTGRNRNSKGGVKKKKY